MLLDRERRKNMKKILFILLGLFLLPNVVFAQNNINGLNIEMNEEEVYNLKNLGFSDLAIDGMDYATFLENKDLIGKVLSQEVKYYKTVEYYNNASISLLSLTNNDDPYLVITKEISEEEYNNSEDEIIPMSSCGFVSTEYKILQSSIVAVNGRYRYVAELTWKKMPKVRNHDIIGIGIDSDVSVISSTKKLINTVKDNGTTKTNNTIKKTTTSSSGIAVAFPLYSSTSITTMNITFYVEVQKRNTNTLTVLNNYADYAHGTKSTTVIDSVGFSISAGVISFSAGGTINEFDSMSTAHAILDGIKW